MSQHPITNFTWNNTVLFWSGLIVASICVFWHIQDFPIYFFCDEAIFTTVGKRWVSHYFRGDDGVFFPMYFEIASGRFTTAFFSYIQGMVATLFGNSVFVARTCSALTSLIGIFALGKALKESGRITLWGLTPTMLPLLPAWLIWARTAFDPAIAAAFLSIFLYTYTRYRNNRPREIFFAAITGGMAYYTYASSQVYFPIFVFLLFISDFRYHIKNRFWFLAGCCTAFVISIPALYFNLHSKVPLSMQLHALDSFSIKNIPLSEKISQFLENYLYSLSPEYWIGNNSQDNIRHIFFDRSYIPKAIYILIAIGFLRSISLIKVSFFRMLLLATLTIPIPAALFATEVNRMVLLLIPFSALAIIGLDLLIALLRYPKTLLYLSAGTMSCCALFLTYDGVTNGPVWFHNYTLYGLQYGARQIFGEAIPRFLDQHPGVKIAVSSSWANAPENFPEFFLTEAQRQKVRIGSAPSSEFFYIPLNPDEIFVVTPDDLKIIRDSGRFKEVKILETIPAPDGTTGFYFVELSYKDSIREILAQEYKSAHKLIEESITVNGVTLNASHSRFDIGSLADIFDGDPTTLARSAGLNPFILELSFPNPIVVGDITWNILSRYYTWKLELFSKDDFTPKIFNGVGKDTEDLEPKYSYMSAKILSPIHNVEKIRITITQNQGIEPDYIHVREIQVNQLP